MKLLPLFSAKYVPVQRCPALAGIIMKCEDSRKAWVGRQIRARKREVAENRGFRRKRRGPLSLPPSPLYVGTYVRTSAGPRFLSHASQRKASLRNRSHGEPWQAGLFPLVITSFLLFFFFDVAPSLADSLENRHKRQRYHLGILTAIGRSIRRKL